MANIIEISNDTILKLVVRSGTDQDRQQIVLDVGELGYTTDHKRLFVGDAVTTGGVLVGNVFNGARTDVTAYTNNPQPGDFAFDTDTNTLYSFEGGNPSNINDWLRVGVIHSVADTTLSARDNLLTVGSLSAHNISRDAIGQSLGINDFGRITLAPSISTQNITISNQTRLTENISISGIDYTFPHSLSADGFLKTDLAGNLEWRSLNTLLCATSSSQITVGSGLSLLANGVPVTTTELITSSEITIDTIHSPAAMCVFKQNGAITRQVGVSAVNVDTLSQLLADGVTYNGYGLVDTGSLNENSDGTGAYRIKFDARYKVLGSDIDVDVKNGSNFASTTFDGTSGEQTLNFQNQTLDCGYYIIPDDGDPTTFDEVMFYVLAPVNSFVYTAATNEWVTSPVEATLTPGYDNSATRFKVSVYGNLA
jgi:hypothetical protein